LIRINKGGNGVKEDELTVWIGAERPSNSAGPLIGSRRHILSCSWFWGRPRILCITQKKFFHVFDFALHGQHILFFSSCYTDKYLQWQLVFVFQKTG
jgi:hypothetical protein